MPAAEWIDRAYEDRVAQDATGALPALADPDTYFRSHGSHVGPIRPTGGWIAAENAQMYSRVRAEHLDNLRKPWAKRSERAFREVTLWSREAPQVWSTPPVNSFHAQYEAAQRTFALKTIPNSLGRIAVGELIQSTLFGGVQAHQGRTEWEMLRANMALTIYEAEHGRLPTKLDELVRAGLLPKAPVDFFSGGTLLYDPARRAVWSVGYNCKDDGGTNHATKDIVVYVK
jgi:hypothetical protein